MPQTKPTQLEAQENRHKAMSHPLRARMLRVMSERAASPIGLSREFGTDVSNVAYHARRLLDLKCIELVDTRPRRGATEHFYRAIERQLIETRDWPDLPVAMRRNLLVEFMQPGVDDFEASVAANILGEDEKFVLTRTRHVLDQQGFDDARALHEQLMADMERVREESANRQAETGGPAVHVSSVINCFEVPPVETPSAV